jgi:multidrug efflux pump subunit AcrB
MKSIELSVRHWVTVVVFLVLVSVVGVYAYIVLPREAAPDIEFPYINVSVSYEGTAPGDMESLVTMPIERKLKGLDGLKEMRSSSSEGMTVIGL